jgi:uncharacterized membrane protein YphA (DoxX/SURF4 family)
MRRTALQTVSAVLVTTLLSGAASAHVDYVTEPGEPGSVADLFGAIASSPASLAVLALGGVATLALAVGYLRFARTLPDVQAARETLHLVAVVGLGTYAFALATTGTELLPASEYVAGFLAIALVGPGQPSADMMLRRMGRTEGTIASRFRGLVTPQELLTRAGIGQDAVPVALRVFLGLNFLYLGVVQKLLQPAEALAVVAKYDLTSVVPVAPELWVVGAGLVEAGVGLAFVLGLFTRGTATVAFLMLTTTLFGLPDDPVLAHITLFGLTSALMVTGAGRYSLDETVLPALRQRLDPASEPPAPAGAD